jgi:ATP-binding cassette, subfamily B, bacterial
MIVTRRHALRRALAMPWRAAPVASVLGLVLAAGMGSVVAAGAYLSRALVVELTSGTGSEGSVLVIAVAAAVVTSLATAGWFAAHYVDDVIRARVTLHVERELFTAVIGLDQLAYFENPTFHAKLLLASEAARSAPQQLTSAAQTMVRTAIAAVTLVGVVMFVWPPMGLLLGGLGLLSMVAQLARARHQIRITREMAHGQRWHAAYQQLLLDPRAAKEIRLYGATTTFRDRMLGRLATTCESELARERAGAVIQVGIAVIAAVISVIGTIAVAHRVLAGSLGVGDLVLFTAAVSGIHAAFGGLIGELGQVGVALELFRGYLEITDAPRPAARALDVPPLVGAIVLQDVWFRYTADGPWVLRGVDLVIPAGATIGIVGNNGAGKSTLVKLLGRFYDVERGSICWDGIDIRALDPVALRRRLAATFQDFMTYDLSAEENISVAAPSAALVDIRAAAAQVDIDDTLAGLPSGYATLLSSVVASEPSVGQVSSLSGGQWQRVAIARALLRDDASVAILDEPSSNLDAEAEALIHAAIDRRFAGKTRILISHRLSAMRGASTIVVLAGGQITERGTHDELMARRGAYARMFSTQARGYQDARVGAA